MPSFNQVVIVGNLTKDPLVKYLPSGSAVCEMSVAINESRTNKETGEKTSNTVFVDVTLWDKVAEIAGEFLAKGAPVLVSGKLSQDSWTDKTTGQQRSKLKVTGYAIQMLGQRGQKTAHDETSQEPSYSEPESQVDPNATPF